MFKLDDLLWANRKTATKQVVFNIFIEHDIYNFV